MTPIITALTILAALDFPELCQQALPPEMPFLLDDFVELNKFGGWKTKSMPSKKGSRNVHITKRGSLDPAVQNQDVTFVYKWAVLAVETVEPGTKRKIAFNAISSPQVECVFDDPGLDFKNVGYDLARRKANRVNDGGLGVRFVAEAKPGEQLMDVFLQEVILVYSREKAPQLLSFGYKSAYAEAELVKPVR